MGVGDFLWARYPCFPECRTQGQSGWTAGQAVPAVALVGVALAARAKSFNLKLSGIELYYTNSLILLACVENFIARKFSIETLFL